MVFAHAMEHRGTQSGTERKAPATSAPAIGPLLIYRFIICRHAWTPQCPAVITSRKYNVTLSRVI